MRAQYARLSPAGQVAKAVAYSLNRWDGLARFLDDVLARLHDHPAKRIAELQPWNWKRLLQQKAAA